MLNDTGDITNCMFFDSKIRPGGPAATSTPTASLDKQIIKLVNQQFSEREASLALYELQKISLSTVMGQSETNLHNTHLAILKLAKGDLEELSKYVESARKDFRDVIFWASEEQ